jgi:hypothetical protein
MPRREAGGEAGDAGAHHFDDAANQQHAADGDAHQRIGQLANQRVKRR